MTPDVIARAKRLVEKLSNGGNWRSMRQGNQAVNISSQYPFKGEHCGASIVEGLPRAWNPHFVGIDVFTLPKEFNESRFTDADADFIAAAPALVRDLLALIEAKDTEAVRCSRCDQEVPDHGDLVCVDCVNDSKAQGWHPIASAPKDGTPEVCICAAVLTNEGVVVRGHRHHDAMYAAKQAFCTPKRDEASQGFITSTGRYVDREAGYRLQTAAGVGSICGYRGERLFSEDLY